MTKVSRRAAVGVLATIVTTPKSIADTADSAEAELIKLIDERDSLPNKLDHSSGHDEIMAFHTDFDRLSLAIATTQATSLRGLIAKARATAWALELDFDPTKELSNHMQVVASIVRDLLKLDESGFR